MLSSNCIVRTKNYYISYSSKQIREVMDVGESEANSKKLCNARKESHTYYKN